LLRPDRGFISRYFISSFGVNALKQFTPGLGKQVYD